MILLSTLDNLANSSYERRQQRIMKLRRDFNDMKYITVDSVVKLTGYTEATVIKWAKDGNIPLLIDNGTTVVPVTDENRPTWMGGS